VTNKEIEDLAGHRQVPAWVIKLVGDAVAVERESCAKLCDEIPALNPMFLLDVAYEAATLDCADAIRARGNNDV
jgi:hypothetical protein